MTEETASLLDEFISENWGSFESFCNDRGEVAEVIMEEVREQAG